MESLLVYVFLTTSLIRVMESFLFNLPLPSVSNVISALVVPEFRRSTGVVTLLYGAIFMIVDPFLI